MLLFSHNFLSYVFIKIIYYGTPRNVIFVGQSTINVLLYVHITIRISNFVIVVIHLSISKIDLYYYQQNWKLYSSNNNETSRPLLPYIIIFYRVWVAAIVNFPLNWKYIKVYFTFQIGILIFLPLPCI